MRTVIQRVKKASVKVNGQTIGQIKKGLLILAAIGREDRPPQIEKLAAKILNLRIFADENDKMNLSVLESQGEILVVPQFTLYADCSQGNRPFFGPAAPPDFAQPLWEKFIKELEKSGLKVEKGQFGAKMEVESINDGPVTIILESKNLKPRKRNLDNVKPEPKSK